MSKLYQISVHAVYHHGSLVALEYVTYFRFCVFPKWALKVILTSVSTGVGAKSDVNNYLEFTSRRTRWSPVVGYTIQRLYRVIGPLDLVYNKLAAVLPLDACIPDAATYVAWPEPDENSTRLESCRQLSITSGYRGQSTIDITATEHYRCGRNVVINHIRLRLKRPTARLARVLKQPTLGKFYVYIHKILRALVALVLADTACVRTLKNSTTPTTPTERFSTGVLFSRSRSFQ